MTEPIWVAESDVLPIHERLLVLEGGAAGIRDEHLLRSALAKPRHQFAYSEGCDILSMAAAYTAGIARNHPFLDGNKRTAFAVGILFLELNGYVFEADQQAAAGAVLELVRGEMDEAGYAAFLRRHAIHVQLPPAA